MNQKNIITTILFDVGWPIVDETEAHKAWNDQLKKLVLSETGKRVSDEEIKKHEDDAVRSFAPSMFSYVIWQLVKPDKMLFDKFRAKFDSNEYLKYYKLQPDIEPVLEKLSGNFKLGLVANQPPATLDFLQSAGVLQYFKSRLVSDEIGFSKPDVRLFLRVLEDIGSKPEDSIMVGDRLDNDIIPAKSIGMKTVWLRIGPHRDQKPRYPSEEADIIINRPPDILCIPMIASKL